MSVNVWTSAGRAISALVLTLAFALMLMAFVAHKADAEPRIKTIGCRVYAINEVDPIGHADHVHEHFGNTSTSNDTTGGSLAAHNQNSCAPESDWFTSAGWFPTPQSFDARKVFVYYRAPGDQRTVKAIPTGLKLLTHEVIFNGSTTSMQFPNCLAVQNGAPVLESFDHESHAVDARKKACPSSHPYRIPRISFLISWPSSLTTSTLVSVGNDEWAPAGGHMHADYFAANQDEFNDRLLDLCLRNAPDSVTVAHPDCGKEAGN
jgi:uncharacterized protein DUF1996